jgi:hypothetical protein
MTVMNQQNQSTPAKPLTGYVRWLLPAALLALMPKCLLCLAAYAGIGAALGLGGPEICGASSRTMGLWVCSLALGGLALGVTALYIRHRRRHEAEK